LLSRELQQLIDLKEQRYFHIVEAELGHLFGFTDPGRLATVTFAFFGLCNWIPSWYRPGGPLGIDEICDINFSIFMGGISSLAARAPAGASEQQGL
jgi:hypothetical protein